MRARIHSVLVLVAVAAAPWLPDAADAQAVRVAPHVGTLGLGADAALSVTRNLGIRAGLNVQPWSVRPDVSDVDMEAKLPSPALTGTVDLHPTGGGFRLSAGLVHFGRHVTARGTPRDSVEFGEGRYGPEEVGSVTATFETRRTAPYAGIGWGGSSGRGPVGFFLDLGVAFTGSPSVSVDADGILGSDPEFRREIEAEARSIEEELEPLRLYPVISLGLTVRAR